MKFRLRSIALLFAVCMLVSLCAASVGAVEYDLTREDCSITVYFPEYFKEDPWYFVADIYLVATVNEDLSLTAEPAFGGLQELLVLDETGEYASKAIGLEAMKIVAANAEIAPIEPVQSWCSLETPIDNLAVGVYLVVVRGSEQEQAEFVYNESGELTGTTASTLLYDYQFAPVLVSLAPTKGSDGDWVTNVDVNLKPEQSKKAQKKLELKKTDENGRPLKDAEFKLYSTRFTDNVDLDDTITVYIEGQGYVTLYCVGKYTTDANGEILIDPPVMDDDTLYAWVESKAPNGYVLDETPHFFFAYGDIVVLRNDTWNYQDWINYYPSDAGLQTRLRYDPDKKNDFGIVIFERQVTEEAKSVVTLTNVAEQELPVYVRVKAEYNWEGQSLDGESLGMFTASAFGEGWYDGRDGWWYYDEILYPGQSAAPLSFTVESDGISDLPALAGRVAILYDMVQESFDENTGRSEANWSCCDPLYHEGGEPESIGAVNQPLPNAQSVHGGYLIDMTDFWGVKACYETQFVGAIYYRMDGGVEDPITVENKEASEPEPPEEPGLELPETGGMGTTVYYIAGSGLVAIAVFLLAVRKRRTAR